MRFTKFDFLRTRCLIAFVQGRVMPCGEIELICPSSLGKYRSGSQSSRNSFRRRAQMHAENSIAGTLGAGKRNSVLRVSRRDQYLPSPTGKSADARRSQADLVCPVFGQEIFLFRFFRNRDLTLLVPLPTRGAYASSRTWSGMRWTGMCRETSGPFADGEVVWSWRAHAGAKLSQDSKGLVRATVANAGSPGRARNKS